MCHIFNGLKNKGNKVLVDRISDSLLKHAFFHSEDKFEN